MKSVTQTEDKYYLCVGTFLPSCWVIPAGAEDVVKPTVTHKIHTDTPLVCEARVSCSTYPSYLNRACLPLDRWEDICFLAIKESPVSAKGYVYMKWLLFEMHLPAEALEGFRREK